MKILWLSHLVPFPPQGGGVLQRSANLLKVVAETHDVTLLAFNQKGILQIYNPDLSISLPAALESMESMCKEVHVIDIECDTKYLGKLRLAINSLFSIWPYSIRWLTSKKYKRKLNEILDNRKYDVIWFDTISLAQYKSEERMAESLLVLNHHNVESDMMFRRAGKEKSFLKRLYFYLEAVKLKWYEKKEVGRFNVNVTCSKLDSQRLEIISPNIITHVIPNGVDTEFFSVNTTIEPDKYFLVFIGGMSWYPNEEAMLFFARKVWPLLKNEIPEVHMHVVGETPSQELIELASNDDNYHVHGFVDDIKNVFYQAGIYVCPISDGGGTKLKILDALAMGKPIVANKVACEGIDVVEGTNVLYAQTPEEYVNRIKELIGNPSLRTKLSKENRRLIDSQYSYQVIGQKLLRLLERKI